MCRGKGLFQLSDYSLSLREARAGAQGRTVEAGAETESVEDAACLLASGSHSVTQAHSPVNVPTHSRSTNLQSKQCHKSCPKANAMKASPHRGSLFPGVSC